MVVSTCGEAPPTAALAPVAVERVVSRRVACSRGLVISRVRAVPYETCCPTPLRAQVHTLALEWLDMALLRPPESPAGSLPWALWTLTGFMAKASSQLAAVAPELGICLWLC